jgi:hypothetical protein
MTMVSRCRLVAALVASALFMPELCVGADLPATNARLKIRRHPRSKTFQLVVRQPPFFPGAGSADDPVVGSPGGMTIEIITLHEGLAAVVAPGGAGTPGWTSDPTRNPPRFEFGNPSAPDQSSPVKSVRFVSGRVLKVTSKFVPLPLLASLGSVAVRVTVGSLRTCARFDGSSVRRDVPGAFSARVDAATGPADCSDDALSDNTCGNGVVEGVEACDGGTCGGTTNPGYCGFPGTVSACECCNVACGELGTCCPTDQCERQPGVFNGRCIRTICRTADDCGLGRGCENGRCCSHPVTDPTSPEPGVCEYTGQWGLPCCAPAVCGPAGGGYALCCFPAGEACLNEYQCCSGTCAAGHCD